MKRLVVTECDKWLMDVTDDEYEALKNGDVDITEMFEATKQTDRLMWKNGSTDWEFGMELETRKFNVGDRRVQYGFYGGVTTYIVKAIDRVTNRILLAEEWSDVDGTGMRPAQWHKLSKDSSGNEIALDWTSEEFGDIWIYA